MSEGRNDNTSEGTVVGLVDPDKLRALMLAREMTQARLAEHAGITQQAVSYMLQAPRNVQVAHALAIAQALGVEVADLVSRYAVSTDDTER